MEKNIVYFDSGTSNSRIYLLDENFTIHYSAKKNIGSKDTSIDGNNRRLLQGLYELYTSMLGASGLKDEDIAEIYASGMVTSPYGIHEVPHCQIPISVKDFSDKIFDYKEDQVFHRTFHLVPGIKSVSPDIAFTNNMRGEEIEIIGSMDDLAKMFPDHRKIALILPGSHTHTVLIEDASSVTGIVSQMTGELFYGIQQDTVLSAVLREPIDADTLDEDKVNEGLKNLQAFGFNRAIYICHAMRLFNKGTKEQRISYAEGVISGDFLKALDWYLNSQWTGCTTAVIVSNEFNYKLYKTILSNSAYLKDIEWLPIGDIPFTVKGLKKILSEKV